MMRVAEQILRPLAPPKIESLNQADWVKLVQAMQTTVRMADEVVSLHSIRLEPEQLVSVLAIKNRALDILRYHAVWPDVLGVPDSQLPASSVTSTVKVKRAYSMMAANAVVEMLDSAAKLLHGL